MHDSNAQPSGSKPDALSVELMRDNWLRWMVSNHRPSAYEADELTICSTPQYSPRARRTPEDELDGADGGNRIPNILITSQAHCLVVLRQHIWWERLESNPLSQRQRVYSPPQFPIWYSPINGSSGWARTSDSFRHPD